MHWPKVLLLLLGCLIALCLFLSWSSYPLQDGYRLQGFRGTNGWIFRGFLEPVLVSDLAGVQGCTGHLYGWVYESKPANNFLIETDSTEVRWFEWDEFSALLKSIGCPVPDLTTEVNLTEYGLGDSFISH